MTLKPRGDGEPRADGEGSHWFCGCVPGTQECHCHDCLLASRDEARAVAREILHELGYPHRIAQFEREHPWLKETPADAEEQDEESRLPGVGEGERYQE